MKKLIYIACVLFTINTNAQITYEFTQDSASTIPFIVGGVSVQNQLMIINFETLGDKYVSINRLGSYISIYDMSHVLVKIISWAGFPATTGGVNNTTVLYFSQLLFNTDNKIEFMYVTTAPKYTGIYNEDGTLLFSDTGFADILLNTPLQQYPIYNTTAGTKMILSYSNGQAKVFGLAGTLSTAIEQKSHAFASTMGNAYPNPTNSTTTIEYALPKGTMQGEVVFYNTQGTEVKRFKVDNTFSSLLISTTDIPAGTYYYQLQTGGNASGSKKLVVIK